MQNSKLKNFYVRSSLFTILSLASAVCSYALYPVLVRILAPSQFGEFAVMIAILNQVLGVLLAINVVSIYLVKKYGEVEAREKAQTIQKALVWFFIAVSIVVIALSPFLYGLFKLENPTLFVIMAATLFISLPPTIWTGYLQGHKELVRIGIFTLSSTFSKLIVASILALYLGALGGLLGVLIGALIGIVVITIYPGVKLPKIRTIFEKSNQKERIFLASIKFYIAKAIFVVGTLGLLQNFDITLAKALFGPTAAGLYSGVSIISNGLYYLAFILIWIVLPEIHIGQDKANRRVLSTAYKLLAVLAVSAISVEVIFKEQLSSLLLGEAFVSQGNLLIFATLYQLTLISIVLYSFYLLVLRKNRGVMLVGLVLLFCLSVPVLFGKTPLLMIQSLWLSLILAIVVYATLAGIYSLRTKRR